MSKRDMGGNAFPARNEANVNDTMGMSMWDFYAATALTGLLSSDGKIKPGDAGNPYALLAGEIADAMLAERRKRESRS